MSITTTLADIRAADPCSNGFAKIRDHLGVSPADAKENHEPFPVALLLETNDLGDALWVLDNVIGNKRLCRLFAADCAESVLPIFERHRPDDDRPRHAISVGRDPNSTDAARAAAGTPPHGTPQGPPHGPPHGTLISPVSASIWSTEKPPPTCRGLPRWRQHDCAIPPPNYNHRRPPWSGSHA
jgi:hypothetical protein